MKALVSIGAYDVPAPSTYSGTTSTIVDSARNVNGYMIGSVIRDDVGKIEMSWNVISAADWSVLLSKFSIARGGSFINPVTFFCQDTNTWETRNMYVSDRSANVYLRDESGNIRGYQNARLSLIEV